MDKKYFKDQVERLEGEIRLKREQLARAKQSLAEASCPFEVGHIIEIPGYAHTGTKAKVISINVPNSKFCDGDWYVTCAVLESNGDIGKIRTNVSERDWQRREVSDD